MNATPPQSKPSPILFLVIGVIAGVLLTLAYMRLVPHPAADSAGASVVVVPPPAPAPEAAAPAPAPADSSSAPAASDAPATSATPAGGDTAK